MNHIKNIATTGGTPVTKKRREEAMESLTLCLHPAYYPLTKTRTKTCHRSQTKFKLTYIDKPNDLFWLSFALSVHLHIDSTLN